MSWDPDVYLSFADLRERPLKELLGRVPPIEVKTAVDLGCGTGNSTAAMAARFPDAKITGIDSSPDMLAKAEGSLPGARWVEADIATWAPDLPVDLILSNAALQWVPDHDRLFAGLLTATTNGGALAIQMPCNFGEPSHVLLRETAKDGPWAEKVAALAREAPVDAPEIYYDRLALHVRHLDIWETTYMQVLEGEDAVFQWTSGTALRPFLAALEGAERDAFCEAYKARLRDAYPVRADGKTLFPFGRLFIVAVK